MFKVVMRHIMFCRVNKKRCTITKGNVVTIINVSIFFHNELIAKLMAGFAEHAAATPFTLLQLLLLPCLRLLLSF